jgi:hypothetical protein
MTSAQKEISLSIGLNRSNIAFINSNTSTITQYKSGYFFGIRNVFIKKTKFELSSEIQYSTKGWDTPNAIGLKETFNYLDGIHLFTYKPVKNIGLYVGMNTGFLLNNNNKFADRKFDFGLVTGLKVGNDKIKVFMHYNYGLLTTKLEDIISQGEVYNYNNNNLQLGLNYILFKKKENGSKRSTSPKSYEFGVKSSNLSKFEAIFKQKMDTMKYIRYDLSFSEFSATGIKTEFNHLSIGFQLGFGIEKRKEFEKLEILHGIMYQLRLTYNSGQRFIVTPFVGYLIGAQYKYNEKFNFGMELVPGFTFDIINNTGNTSFPIRTEFNASFSFKNAPSFFVTYRLNNESDQ